MTAIIADALAALSARRDLVRAESTALFTAIMSGEATPAQIGGVLMALKLKGETVEEIAGAVQAMRSLATHVPVTVSHLVDTCGTGGSGTAKLFNISTAAAFVAAATGAHVAKHGNRGMTSKSGSADVLEAAGVRIDLTAPQIARCIAEIGVGFMFAPAHHGAMKHAAGVRRELGVRTIFNLLGPLTNPARAPNQVIGVADASWLRKLAEVLRALGSRHVMLVSSDGLDEISTAAPTAVAELLDGEIREYTISPGELGIAERSLATLRADSPAASLALVTESLTKPDSAAADIIALNAGAAIYTSGIATTLSNGVKMAQDAIAAGLAKEKLDELVRVTRLMAGNA